MKGVKIMSITFPTFLNLSPTRLLLLWEGLMLALVLFTPMTSEYAVALPIADILVTLLLLI